MTDIYGRIKDKNIVIWGVGILQSDLEGLYSFEKLLYYVDDSVPEKNKISVPKEKIYAPSKLAEEEQENLMVVICTEDWDDAVARLKAMGYGREHYVMGRELLLNPSLYQKIHEQEISIWGTGGSYFYHEQEIRRYLPKVINFISAEKKEEEFQGKKVLSMEEAENGRNSGFVVVASIYYKDIYTCLLRMGLRPGRDFIHIETLVSLGNLSTRCYGDCQFHDRKKDFENLLVVLAGYKEFVWESVFARLHAYVPKDIDICIVTSGLENAMLQVLCEENEWSYLSTSRNNVSLAVNLAVCLHPKAEYIYKMDEDIFVTNGVFATMKNTYLWMEQKGKYAVGFTAPLIPVNGYSYVRLLEIFHAEHLWEERFGQLKYTDCDHHHSTIRSNPKAASFMWGEGNPNMDSLDEMQRTLQGMEFQYSICPIRYSIGFILFHRENWLRMEAFPVSDYINLGLDEEHLCQFCLMQGRAMVIAENAVVGHLAYGMQNKEMEEYYNAHKEKFGEGNILHK